MLTRYAYLENDYNLANSGTRTTDIKIIDPITALWIEAKCANGVTYNHDSPMHLCISAIEVIDGSTVLFSLDGAELLGYVCGQLGFMPHQQVNETGYDLNSLALPIMFGRFLGDTQYAFDPRKFTNPQVRITWDLATLTTVGATGFSDGDMSYTLMAQIMEGAPAPIGFIQAKEVFTYTTAVGVEYIDLPIDLPYVALMVRCVAGARHWYTAITDIKLSIDGDKQVPIDMKCEDLQNFLFLRQPRLEYRHLFHKTSAETIKLLLKEHEHVVLMNEESYDMVHAYSNWGYGEQTIAMYSSGTPTTSYYNMGAHVTGYWPYHCIYIPFGDLQKPTEWFPVRGLNSVRLELTGGVAALSNYICLAQERRY